MVFQKNWIIMSVFTILAKDCSKKDELWWDRDEGSADGQACGCPCTSTNKHMGLRGKVVKGGPNYSGKIIKTTEVSHIGSVTERSSIQFSQGRVSWSSEDLVLTGFIPGTQFTVFQLNGEIAYQGVVRIAEMRVALKRITIYVFRIKKGGITNTKRILSRF